MFNSSEIAEYRTEEKLNYNMAIEEQNMCTNRKANDEDLETSDPINHPVVQSIERPRVNEPEPAQNATKYIGVVPQPNGNWGAQIYANNHRFWLGTFKSELEAAMAYDSAAIKLRTGDFHRNFPWTVHTVQEHNFQTQFSSEAILSMIRDGSYQPKFQEFLRLHRDKGKAPADVQRVHRDGEFTIMQLFEKELTPSDVGKLNRLVIPKKFAVKCLPYVPEDVAGDDGLGDLEIDLYDSRLMRSWSFRYSYWKSSQSYVFTKGWSKFVKEKNLKDKDVVMFYTCTSKLGHVLCIDVRYASSNGCTDTELNDGRDDHQEARGLQDGNVVVKKRLRLFGVWIEDGSDVSQNRDATN